MYKIKKSFKERVKEIKEELTRDKQEMEKIEKRIEAKH
ncbi:FbpB family small basic protein [Priestia endophytica]|nr:FbpB family small basic protein [Priestia endophytica]RAS83645.1 FbpB family small basic protein [Priestia endophytica]